MIGTNQNPLLNLPLPELLSLANTVREEHIGQNLELCSIINAKSGLCSEDCKFCAQSSKHTSQVNTYSLKSRKEIVQAAGKAKEIGAEKFGIVTSGNRLTSKELEEIVAAALEIKEKIGISVCGSLGALKRSALVRLKKVGLSRYHHNIETSRRFYPEIVSTHTFQERVDTVKAAKDVGMQVCSGGIIGLGETWQDRVDMAITLRDLGVDSVPINLLVPMAGTPLASVKPLSANDAIRTICIFRIILRDKIIKIAAGRESVLGDSQKLGFMAGANGMLIGGYLTIKGRDLKEDRSLVEEIRALWKK
tara:strand:- start:636 stop:1553 length:918 start_codon:yes stop_codon:yes gene_type:complete